MNPEISDGVLAVDGVPDLVLAGDYPYYRDLPSRWAGKLDAIRDAGLSTVSFYVPWRHHELSPGRFTFTGPGNRDLVGFLGLVHTAGLRALPKPGPHVHAELPLGGLPDRVSPTHDPSRAAVLSAVGEPLLEAGVCLPSPHDPAFRADAARWLQAVGDLLRPLAHPGGPVTAVQVGNEGHFGEIALPVSATDYSVPGLAAFARSYPGVRAPRTRAPGADGIGPYVDWAAWLNQSLADDLDEFAELLGISVPMLLNAAPPAEARSPELDSWLSRSGPAQPRMSHYGFTNWTGDLTSDDDALVRYVLAAKRASGPLMEENWSLRWVTERCAAACVPIYRSLLGLACGASGINVYTVCATADWGPHLQIDREYLRETTGDPAQLDPPYGDAAPIGVDGSAGPSLDALRTFARFLGAAGPALAGTLPERGPVLLVQPAHAAVTAWRPGPGAPTPPPADRTIAPFVRHCLRSAVPFSVAFATTEGAAADRDRPIVTTSGPFMSVADQTYLASQARTGRPILLLGALPATDERGKPCTVLADCAREDTPITVVADLDEVTSALAAWPATAPRDGRQQGEVVELRRVGHGGDLFVFLFYRAGLLDAAVPVETTIPGGVLRTTLAPGGCAVVHCRAGRLIGAYVKGGNELTGCAIRPEVTIGDQRLAAAVPGDLSAYAGLS